MTEQWTLPQSSTPALNRVVKLYTCWLPVWIIVSHPSVPRIPNQTFCWLTPSRHWPFSLKMELWYRQIRNVNRTLTYGSSFPYPTDYFRFQEFILLFCASLSAILILVAHSSPHCYRLACFVFFFINMSQMPFLHNMQTESLKLMEKWVWLRKAYLFLCAVVL
jgi:hypothetical protein